MNNHSNKIINMKIGSINCRTIYKNNNLQHTDNFIRYLRQQQLNILLCQETNMPLHSFDNITQSLNMKFQAHQTLWTKYCGIINLSQFQNMELIQQSDDQRFLLIKLTWSDESIQPIFILNLYAPASNAADRNVFFSSIIHQLNS